MAWRFVPASVDLSLDFEMLSGSSTEQSAGSNATTTPSRCSRRESGRARSIARRSGTTCEPSMAARGVAQWISSLQASRASRTQRLAEAVASQRISGQKCSESSGSASRRWSSWKTSPSERSESPQLICAASAFPAGSLASAPPSWVPRISARDGGYLPTMTTRRNQLSNSMQKWPAYRRLRALVGRSCKAEFWEWMMGLPIEWTDCDALATEPIPLSQPQRSACSLEACDDHSS